MSDHQDSVEKPTLIRSSSSSLPKPKGILKNAQHGTVNQPGHSLQWDEENIALTEIGKDSLMKITEPKTPYVRYNAETDEIEGDIPDLSLSGGYSSMMMDREMAPSPPLSVSPTNADTSGPSSRRTSISSAGHPEVHLRSPGSGASSRSTSFNLPNEARRDLHLDGNLGDEIGEDSEMDEETAAKHAAFVRARKGHYSNEAEAMKRAAAMLEDEEDESRNASDTNDDDSMISVDDSEEGGPRPSRRVVPPVPRLPTKINGNGSGNAA